MIIMYKDFNELNEAFKTAVRNIGQNNINEMNAYHGGAASFSEFDTEFVGTGESAQIYGWGTYLTDSEDLAEFYIRNAILNNYNRYSDDELKNFFKLPKYKKKLDPYWNATLYKVKNGYLYTVEIPDNDGTNYIDWNESDKSKLAEILNNIKPQLSEKQFAFMSIELADKAVSIDKGLYAWAKGKWKQIYDTINTFARFYSDLSHILGSPKEASICLSKAGYIGITVPMSNRSKKKDLGLNYVIFNTKRDIKLVKKDKILYNQEKMDRTSGNASSYKHIINKQDILVPERIKDLGIDKHIAELEGQTIKALRYANIVELEDGRKYYSPVGIRCTREHCGGFRTYKVEYNENLKSVDLLEQ